MKGKYLAINYKRWRDYTIKDSLTPSAPVLSTDNIVHPLVENDNDDPTKHKFAIKVAFLVGQTLSNETQQRIVAESDIYGDVIQESFLDSYNNLTLKTIMMLKWVNGTCCDKGKCVVCI